MYDSAYFTIGKKHVCFPFDAILYIEANGNYAIVADSKNHKATVSHTLFAIQTVLPPNLFVRIHRSFIISVKKITRFDKGMVTVGKEEIPINEEAYKVLCSMLIMPDKTQRSKKFKTKLAAVKS